MSKILRGISESVEHNDDMFSAVLEYLGQTQPELFSRYGDEKVANTVQTIVATARDYVGGPKKFAQQVIINLQSPEEQGVAEGKNSELDSLYDQYDELDYDGNSESDREKMRHIQQKIRDLKAKQGVAEAGYPDVDHMPGLVNKYNRTPVKPTSNNKFYTDKKQWLRDVDDINHSKYDDNSEYIGQTGRSSVEINGVPWAVWSDAKQKGYIAMGAMSEEKQRLDPKCWSGYKKQGTKMKGDTRVNNCVPVGETEKEADYGDDYQSMVSRVGQKAKEQEKKKPVDIAALARRLNKPEPKKVDEFVSGTVMARPRHVPSQVELEKKKSDIMKGIDENLGTPYPSTYEQENDPFKHKGAHRTTSLTTEVKKK